MGGPARPRSVEAVRVHGTHAARSPQTNSVAALASTADAAERAPFLAAAADCAAADQLSWAEEGIAPFFEAWMSNMILTCRSSLSPQR